MKERGDDKNGKEYRQYNVPVAPRSPIIRTDAAPYRVRQHLEP